MADVVANENVKAEAVEEKSDVKGQNGSSNGLNEKIVTQLEYYFGDINLPRDKFLQEKMKENEGWVAISTLLTFNRLKNLSPDEGVIASAVAAIPSDIISLSDDKISIRRNPANALPENSLEYWQKIKHRTLYMKGFPADTSLDAIMQYAAQFGPTENVLMRRSKPDRVFKGSVFATYKTREEAEKARDAPEKFGEIELVKMLQDDYWLMKSKETKEKRAQEKLAKQQKKGQEVAAKNAPAPVHYVKGLILEVKGLPEDSTIASLKEYFAPFGNVGYVVHETGKCHAQIRFHGEENEAARAWEKANAEGKAKIGESELEGKVLEGDEEVQYWEAFNKKRNEMSSRGRGRGGGRGGRGGGRGRGRGDARGRKRKNEGQGDGPVPKKIVFEDDE